LQIRTVLQATTIRDRDEALKTLPSNLDEAFGGTMKRIEQQPPALSEKAATIIAWIHLAERPLTVEDLLCALAIKDGDRCLDERGIPVRETLLNCCHGLALIDQETSTVRLVHYSLEEHLSRQDRILGRSKVEWHSKIACTCLTFLNFTPMTVEPPLELPPEPPESWESPESPLKLNNGAISLVPYAATKWGHHLRKCDGFSDAPIELAKEYLTTSSTSNDVSLLYREIYPYRSKRDFPDQVLPAPIIAYFGVPTMMAFLISTGCDIELMDPTFGRTPLVWASENGHEAVVKMLINAGAEIDSNDSQFDHTPLSWAAHKGHEAVVKILINAGAEIDSKDSEYGRTPLLRAASNGHEAVVKILINAGAEIDSKDFKFDQTPLSWAAENGREAVVKILINAGAEIDSKDCMVGQTPLSRAAEKGKEAVVKILINAGAEIDSKDPQFHQTPLSWAAENGREAVVKMLINAGAEIDSKDIASRTPLSWAAFKGHKAVVKMLINAGAKVDIKHKDGNTPLSLAKGEDRKAVVKLLESFIATGTVPE
jgi:ankyrin repeat protein